MAGSAGDSWEVRDRLPPATQLRREFSGWADEKTYPGPTENWGSRGRMNMSERFSGGSFVMDGAASEKRSPTMFPRSWLSQGRGRASGIPPKRGEPRRPLSSIKAQTKSRGCRISSRDSMRYTLQTHGVKIPQVPRDKCEIARAKFGTEPALSSGSGCRGFPASAAGPFTMRTADRPNTMSADTTIRLIVVSIKNGTPRLKGRSISRLPDVEDGKGPEA